MIPFSNGATGMAGSLRVAAALLGYPDARLRRDLPEMREILRQEAALAPARIDELEALMASLARADLLDAQAAYVQTFDCGRAASLHLFEHVHGDSRERGAAMVDLAQTYERAGVQLAPHELPDYLPAVVEFASLQPPREARAFLGEIAHILESLLGALRERHSPYGVVVAALLELAGAKARAAKPQADPALDDAWAEPPAFGPCPAGAQPQSQPIHIVRRKAQRGAVA